jgi:hypothetical protein
VYGFDITKLDMIFDVLLKDKHISPSDGHKLKGKKYCKFHNKIGKTTNNCIHFRDLIQQAIKD